MDKILDLGISYPDFQLNQIIDPEQIDMNNAQIVDKINRVIIAINRITQGNTGASEIGMGLLPEFPTAKTVQSALNQIATYCKTNNTSIADLTNYNTTQDTRMQTIESKNTEQDTKLQELVSKNTTQDTRMASIERKDSEQDNRIGNIETLNTSQNTRLTGVEQKNTDQDTKLATHETRITNVEQKVEQKDTEQDKRLTDLEVKDDLDETWINGISYRVDKNTNDIVKVNNTLDEIKEVNANVELVNARTSGHTGEAFPYIGDRIDDLEIATGTDIPSNKRGKFTRIITKGEGTQTWENDVKLGSIQIHEQDNNAHTQQFTRHELDNKSHLDIRQDLSSLGQTVSDSVVELNTKINTEVNKLTSQIDNTNNDMQTVDSILNDKITTVDDKITVLSCNSYKMLEVLDESSIHKTILSYILDKYNKGYTTFEFNCVNSNQYFPDSPSDLWGVVRINCVGGFIHCEYLEDWSGIRCTRKIHKNDITRWYEDKWKQVATTDKIDISLFNGWVEQYDSWNSTSLQIIGGEVRGSIWIKNASITQAWATILSIQGATFLTKSRPVLLFSTTTQLQYIGQFNNSALASPANIPVGDYIVTF